MSNDKCPECGGDTHFETVKDYDKDGYAIFEEQLHQINGFDCILRQLHQANAKIAELQAVVDKLACLLKDWGDNHWKPGIGIQPDVKPGHGSCCTCQKCGWHYDDCVCGSNEIEQQLIDIGFYSTREAAEKAKNNDQN